MLFVVSLGTKKPIQAASGQGWKEELTKGLPKIPTYAPVQEGVEFHRTSIHLQESNMNANLYSELKLLQQAAYTSPASC